MADRTLLGQFLETFAFRESRRQASWQGTPIGFFHCRDKDGAETDIVMEQASVAGVDIKAAASVNPGDFRGLRKLRKAAGDRFVRGVVLYDGETGVPFGDRFHAVPMSRLWRMP